VRASRRLITLVSVFALSVPVAELVLAPTAVAAQPAGLSVKPSPAGADTLQVTWSRSSALRRYRVQYSIMPGMTNSSSVIVDGNGALLTGLLKNTRYYVRVEALSFAGASLSSFTDATSAVTASPADAGADELNVATYNIRSVRKQGKGKAWKVRRHLLADAIKKENLAVLGLQEAEHWKVAGGVTQYQDIVNLLNVGVPGEPWKVVQTADTDGTRIAYDSTKVGLVSAGYRELASNHKPDRWVVYSTFRQLSTGRDFFFANTHLISGPVTSSKTKCSKKTTKTYRIRRTEAAQVVSTIQRKAGNLPTVLVGDMNAHKFHCPNDAPYVKYTASGLVDPIDNSARQKGVGNPTAAFQTYTQFDSSNHYAKAPKRHPWPLGTDVDYILVSKSVTTMEYEMVVNINSAGKFIGPPPSDHNMIKATIVIPSS
jgi:endonuclease/exonuclease/phosphatase family metal-dependent hydrolase